MNPMNKNLALYTQILNYQKAGVPKQFLSLPWWIRSSKKVYYPRHSCTLEPLNCGEKLFSKISDDINAAMHSVDIITWGFDPGMVLVRGNSGEGVRYGDLLVEIATRKNNPVTVRLLIWHDDALSQDQMKNIPGYYGLRFPKVGSKNMGYYSETHQAYNAEWFQSVCNEKIPNIYFHVRSIPSSLLGQSLDEETVPQGLHAYVAKLYATHHQKMLLIDYQDPVLAVGYVMGHNSTTDFWDTESHIFQDPRRERMYTKDPGRAWEQGPGLNNGGGGFAGRAQPSKRELELKEQMMTRYLDEARYVAKPYQDVSIRLRGPILFDLNHNFCEGWKESSRPSSMFMDWVYLAGRVIPAFYLKKFFEGISNFIFQGKDSDFVHERRNIKAADFAVDNGRHSAQLIRTQPLHGEKSIKECYANLLRNTQHYIFIQNQYIQYEPWADHLTDCVKRLRAGGFQKKIFVFLLTSTPEKDGMDLPTYDVMTKIGQSTTMVVEHAAAEEAARKNKALMPLTSTTLASLGINVLVGSLWTCAATPKIKSDYEEIYIHAKIAIVDDVAFTLGSANLNLRSMALDSELNLLSEAHEVAYSMRCNLFEQITGQPGPSQFADMESTFNRWKSDMDRNMDKKMQISPLTCQLVAFYVNRVPGSPVL